jgi:hypothetical protein
MDLLLIHPSPARRYIILARRRSSSPRPFNGRDDRVKYLKIQNILDGPGRIGDASSAVTRSLLACGLVISAKFAGPRAAR